jgi:hypothetical protein
MDNSNHGDDRRRNLEMFCDQYVSFWAFACILASFFVGWPALLAWVGLAAGMRVFGEALGGSSSRTDRPHQTQTKPKRRCRD